MQNEFELLNKKFIDIQQKGWVVQKGKGLAAMGNTFEHLLGKEIDDFPLADFNMIEIKTMNVNSKYNLHLFNLTPDGDYLFPIKRLLDSFGTVKKDNMGFKTFYKRFDAKHYTRMNNYLGKLKVNYIERKVELVVYDNIMKNINVGVSWSFNLLNERIGLKIKYQALFYAQSRIRNGVGYYRYIKANYYKLKKFDEFIKLIDEGIISITFKIGVFKSEKRFGQIYDHGTDFSISIENMSKLYQEVII